MMGARLERIIFQFPDKQYRLLIVISFVRMPIFTCGDYGTGDVGREACREIEGSLCGRLILNFLVEDVGMDWVAS